jgi:Tc toxin complex TcA C-terminal TcB-binding domain
LELQQFRETGLLVFATPMEMFDREFPGHYLRLIKRVRLSLFALVRDVRATLSASGLSRVIVAGDEFSSVTLSRSPEAIAFTSPLNATGLFEMEPENGLLLPFEGMGVDTVWQLELPKPANPFDYRTIADVLLTIEYTALNSYEYRQEVLRGQDRSFSGDRAFSVRDQFPDAWYELNNPESVADEVSRMRVILPIRRDDFPPHLEELAVQELTLFCLRKDGFTQELSINSLRYTPPGGEAITAAGVRTTGGIIGTRRPNGAAWIVMVGHDPVGEWSIQLENTDPVRGWFKDGSIQDLVLVVTVTGVTPAWL